MLNETKKTLCFWPEHMPNTNKNETSTKSPTSILVALYSSRNPINKLRLRNVDRLKPRHKVSVVNLLEDSEL